MHIIFIDPRTGYRATVRKLYRMEWQNKDKLIFALEVEAHRAHLKDPRIVMDKDSPVGIKIVGRGGESIVVE